jgi:hypothetical protein
MNFVGFALVNLQDIIIDYGIYVDVQVIYYIIKVPGSMMRSM